MTRLTPDELKARLDRHARVPLVPAPTPLVSYPRLGASLGVGSLRVKHDEMTLIGLGGNKVRELEFFLGAALAEGADVFVAGGGVAQSNHARQCAAAARRVGLAAHLVLRRGTMANERTGNQLLTSLLADQIVWSEDDPGLSDREGLSGLMDAHANALRQQGRRPWVLHSSFHPLGALGYVVAALELNEQLVAAGTEAATIVVTSMGATRVGLEVAARALGLPWKVVGAGWRPVDPDLAVRMSELASGTAALLDLDVSIAPDEMPTLDHGGPVYGVPSAEGIAALHRAAHIEGLALDPVYTAKGFAALIAAVGREIDPHVPVVFLHTGGLPALFAYGDAITTSHNTMQEPG